MFAVDDLTDAELANIKGGSWTKLIESLIMSGLNNIKDIREGFSDGYAGKSRYLND